MRTFKKKSRRAEGAGRPPAVTLGKGTAVSAERGRIRAALDGGATMRLSDPRDAGEREADRVAAAVMKAGAPSPIAVTAAAPVQRLCQGCDEEETVARKTAAEEEEEKKKKKKDEELVQTRAHGDRPGGVASPDAARAVHDVASGGQPLPAPVRLFFEPRLGHDLGQVRVHTGAAAHEATGAVRAEAFTFHNHVAFAEGRYAPETPAGRALLAHELAHVVQQGYAPKTPGEPTPSAPASAPTKDGKGG